MINIDEYMKRAKFVERSNNLAILFNVLSIFFLLIYLNQYKHDVFISAIPYCFKWEHKLHVFQL